MALDRLRCFMLCSNWNLGVLGVSFRSSNSLRSHFLCVSKVLRSLFNRFDNQYEFHILRNSKYKKLIAKTLLKTEYDRRIFHFHLIKLDLSDALVRKFPLNIITLVVWTGLFSMFIAMVATIWVFYSSVNGVPCSSVSCKPENHNGSMYVPEQCINQALG